MDLASPGGELSLVGDAGMPGAMPLPLLLLLLFVEAEAAATRRSSDGLDADPGWR